VTFEGSGEELPELPQLHPCTMLTANTHVETSLLGESKESRKAALCPDRGGEECVQVGSSLFLTSTCFLSVLASQTPPQKYTEIFP